MNASEIGAKLREIHGLNEQLIGGMACNNTRLIVGMDGRCTVIMSGRSAADQSKHSIGLSIEEALDNAKGGLIQDLDEVAK